MRPEMKRLDLMGRADWRAIEHPSLELSSESSSDEEQSEQQLERGHDRAVFVDLSSPLRRRTGRDLLRTAASVHLSDIRSISPSESTSDARTAASSQSNLTYPLREKLRRLSRSQRKELLVRAGGPIPLQHSNSITDYEEPELNDSMRDNSILDQQCPVPFDEREEAAEDSGANPANQMNKVTLHIYDLIAHDTLMQLPWGCVCEIGKCFNEVNSALHQLGTGAYHVGVEVNGVEYAYGATTSPGKSGVFSCIPKFSPGYQYRTSIDFGQRPFVLKRSWVQVPGNDNSTIFQKKIEQVDGKQVMKDMAAEYMGIDYDIIRKNCCTFARDACVRLGIKDEEIPTWFRNLAESSAMTQDWAYATVEPLQKAFSSCEDGRMELQDEDGFEVVPNPDSDKKDHEVATAERPEDSGQTGFRRTATWAY